MQAMTQGMPDPSPRVATAVQLQLVEPMPLPGGGAATHRVEVASVLLHEIGQPVSVVLASRQSEDHAADREEQPFSPA